MSFRGLWIDKDHPIPDELLDQEWCSARSAHEAILKLELLEFDIVSLDRNLTSVYGNKAITSYDLLLWLVERKQEGKFHVPSTVKIHSTVPISDVDQLKKVAKRHFSQ